MAQTKRKRKTKHRGNAAGSIEVRGRTGSKPIAPTKATGKAKARQIRQNKLDNPPTWRGSINRAILATLIFSVALVLLFRENAARTAALAGFIFLLYIPLGYYTDLMLYRMRQKRKAQGKGPTKSAGD